MSNVDKETWLAMERLLDDDSPVVRESLAAWFREHEQEAIHWLKEWAGSRIKTVSEAACHHLRSLEYSDPVDEFLKFIRSLHYELETGALLLNRVTFPKLRPETCSREIDQLALRCQDLLVASNSAKEICKVINRVIFHEEEFRGDLDDFNNPMNSYLSQVLESHKGIPISLGILYILVAQRLGLDLEPVCMPGRFVVGCFAEEMPFYIDPFERGAIRTPDYLFRFLKSRNIVPDISHLAPSSVREVLCRCCRNLVHQYISIGDVPQSQLFARFVHEFEATYRRETSS